MAIHVLRQVQIVPASIEACWAFFSDPRNLPQITPPELDFRVLRSLPSEIHPGLMIEYRVRPLFGFSVTWLTEITHVRPCEYFADEQRVGPYRLWHHEHYFRRLADGRTEVRDLVHYVLPFSPWADWVHPWLVKPKLAKVFGFREQAIREIFRESESV